MADPTTSPLSDSDVVARLSQIADSIRQSGEPLPEEDVYEKAEPLGLLTNGRLEFRGQIRSLHPEIQYVRKSFSWQNAPTERAPSASTPLPKLIEQWIEAPADEERKRIRQEISAAAAILDPADPLISVARATGALEGDADWTKVPLDNLVSEPIITRLVDRAPPAWLFDAATTLPSRLAEIPKRKLQLGTTTERNEVAADGIERWLDDPNQRTTAAARLRRVKSAVGDDFTPLLPTTAVRGARRIIESSEAGDEDDARALAAIAFVLSNAELDHTVTAIEATFDTPEPVRHWLIAIASEAKNHSDRTKLITAVATSSQRAAIFASEVFEGLRLDVLGPLLSTAAVRDLLEGGLSQHVRIAVKKVTPSKIGTALGAVASHPVLEPLMPLEYLSKRLESDEASARLTRAVASPLIAGALEAAREETSLQIEAIQRRLDSALALGEESSRSAEAATARADGAESRLRQAINQTGSARDAELRQAQIDSLRAWAEHIEDLRNLAAVVDRQDLIEQQISTEVRRIQTFGIRVDGVPGEQVAYDSSRHAPLDVVPGAPVIVVSPTYLGDSDTPLRYGLVRQVFTNT